MRSEERRSDGEKSMGDEDEEIRREKKGRDVSSEKCWTECTSVHRRKFLL
jgi:hypothetical protein